MLAKAVLFLLLTPSDDEAARRTLDVAAAAIEAPEPDDDCDDPQTQQRMNFCAALDFGAADAALNAQWELTAAAMKARDTEIDREYDRQPGHYETLIEGQRAWLAYRDAECLSQSFMARGGSMQAMLELHCKAYLTELRTEQLRVLAAGPEDYLTGGQAQ